MKSIIMVILLLLSVACTQTDRKFCNCESVFLKNQKATKRIEKLEHDLRIAYKKLRKKCHPCTPDDIFLSDDYWKRVTKYRKRQDEIRYELQGARSHAEMYLQFYNECVEEKEKLTSNKCPSKSEQKRKLTVSFCSDCFTC